MTDKYTIELEPDQNFDKDVKDFVKGFNEYYKTKIKIKLIKNKKIILETNEN